METKLDSIALMQAREYFDDPKKCIDYNDLRLILAPIDLREALLETARHRTFKPTLILCHPSNGDRHHICDLTVRVSVRKYAWLNELCSDPVFQGDFILRLNSDQKTCEFSARSRVNHSETRIDKLVSRLLSWLLVTGRPLRYYGCTFLLPLDLMLDEDLQKKTTTFKQLINSLKESSDVEHHQINPSEKIIRFSPEKSEVQAYLYFLPLLRSFIVDTQDSANDKAAIKPIQHWRLQAPTIDSMQLQVGLPYTAAKQNSAALIAKVCDVSLYRYYNDLLLFALRVELSGSLAEDFSLVKDDETWWHDLLNFNSKQSEKIKNNLQALQIEN